VSSFFVVYIWLLKGCFSGVGGGGEEGASAPPKGLICRNSKKGLHDLCGRKFIGKSRTTTFRASLWKFGLISFAPQKFACCYTYGSLFLLLFRTFHL